MAYDAGGVEVAAEVAVFQGEVGGDEDFGVGGWAEDRAVIADTLWNKGGGAGGELLADLGDEGELALFLWHLSFRIRVGTGLIATVETHISKARCGAPAFVPPGCWRGVILIL